MQIILAKSKQSQPLSNRILHLILLFIFIAQYCTAQPSSKYELRAAWVATIGNIDWPSSSKLDAQAQQQEFINLLNTFQLNGINAAIVQIRPVADAFYPSSFESWSKYLTGTEGNAPEPYYDPLQFMITECHNRGIEFHAWFNPYRALVDSRKNIHPINHATYTHPDWFINYGGKKYFDPGVPAVRKYVQDVVMEVVAKYNIDAVHFDDYFYPYKIGNLAFGDANSYALYGANYPNKDDWRRANVDAFIQEINTKIKAIKPTVKLGISPFGIWRNIKNDPEGSYTNGCQNYDDLFADVINWQRKGWIDYLMPQLYWERGHRNADFTTLLEWWNRHAYNRGMYIGLGLYQLGVNKASAWRNGAEIPEQITMLRANKNVQGYSLYSANGFYKNKYGIAQTLQYTINKTKAIVPPMKWLDSIAPKKPIANLQRKANGEVTIQLKHNSADANCFVVYRFLKTEKIDITQADKIIAIQNNSLFSTIDFAQQYKFVITSLDQIHNESDFIKVE
jgi:uncharacterized lipoprotein YddW (UPF0748 family)